MTTAAILAGGESRRFGSDKAFMKLDGEILLMKIYRILSDIFDRVYVVGGNCSVFRELGLESYPDMEKGVGTAAGVYSALFHCRENRAFITACDMPFLDAGIITELMGMAGKGEDILLPMSGGIHQTMHAVYGRNCMINIHNDLLLPELLNSVRVNYVNNPVWEDSLTFKSINSMNDLQKYRKLLGVRLDPG